MHSLPHRILEYAEASAEATPICPAGLLHWGSRAAVDQALSRLARGGQLMRICQGVYMRPVETSFGLRAPSLDKVVTELTKLWGEPIVPGGASAANILGLTTQVPVQSVYLTSGPSRRLQLGAHTVQLRHAPRWQLVAPHSAAGVAIRALAWLGPEEVADGLRCIVPRLSCEEFDKLTEARPIMPGWMAESVSALMVHA